MNDNRVVCIKIKDYTRSCYRHLTLTLAGINGQHAAVQEHALLAGQKQKTPTMKAQNTYAIDHHDRGKGLVQCQKISQLLPAKHTPYLLTLYSSDTKDSTWITKVEINYIQLKKHFHFQTTIILQHKGSHSVHVFQTLNCFTICRHYILYIAILFKLSFAEISRPSPFHCLFQYHIWTFIHCNLLQYQKV